MGELCDAREAMPLGNPSRRKLMSRDKRYTARNATPRNSCAATPVQSEREVMSDNPEVEDERPCLHCLMGDLIDEYYGEYGSPTGEPDVIDVSGIMTSLAKIVAEITSGSDAAEGRRIVEELSREISKYDAEYREHAASGTSGFDVRH